MTVSLIKSTTYGLSDLTIRVEGAVEMLGGFQALTDYQGGLILLKPNLAGVAAIQNGATTNIRVIEATIRYLTGQGVEPKNILVGDGPVVGQNISEVCLAAGLPEVIRRYGVQLADFSRDNLLTKTLENGRVLSELHLPAFWDDLEMIINLPKLKTHCLTLMSGAIKNLKGLLSEEDKKMCHQLGLFAAMADYFDFISTKVKLNIMDGIWAMEGIGPTFGDLVKTNLILAGPDALEMDIVAAALMGLDPANILFIKAILAGRPAGDPEIVFRKGASRGPLSRFDLVKLFGLGRPFKSIELPASQTAAKIKFSCGDLCSGCAGLMANVAKFIYDPAYLWEPKTKDLPGLITLAFGKRAPLPKDESQLIRVGNCQQIKKSDKGDLLVPGCPPIAAEVFAALEKAIRRPATGFKSDLYDFVQTFPGLDRGLKESLLGLLKGREPYNYEEIFLSSLSALALLEEAINNKHFEPRIVEFLPTDDCDYNCLWCIGGQHRFFSGQSPKTMSSNKMLEVLWSLSRHGLKEIKFSGFTGEPLKADLLPVMNEAFRLGMLVGLHTNAYLLNRDYQEAMMKGKFIAISLDAARASTYEDLRGTPRGAFKQVIKNIEDTCRLKVLTGSEVFITLGFLVNWFNYKEIYEAARLASQFGATLIQYKLPLNFDELIGKEWQAAYDLMKRAQEDLARPDFKVVLMEEQFGQAVLSQHCYTDLAGVVITPDGNVVPCTYASRNQALSFGNVYQQDFWDIWASQRHWDVMRSLAPGQQCSVCPRQSFRLNELILTLGGSRELMSLVGDFLVWREKRRIKQG